MTARRLPDGSITYDVEAYSAAWQAVAAPLCQATGWAVLGYDPGYLIDTGARAVSLTTDEVRTLSRIAGGAK
jgi:hypothetical protein